MPDILFREDVKRVVSDSNLPWVDMQDTSILITGATGMLGFALAHTLRAASDKHRLNLKIIATGRDSKKLDELINNDCADSAFSVDIRKPLQTEILPEKVDYIFHCAAITESAQMVAKPVDVITTSVIGTKNVLEVARAHYCKNFIYLSSMEVYGHTSLNEVHESDLGFVDLTNPRSSYPESKRSCENLCIAYSVQYGVPVKIARLAQTFGAGTPINDTRVFAQFARSAINGESIVLHTEGKSQGNYCYLSETVSALFYILLLGKNSEIYNVANTKACATIREMAEIAASMIEPKTNVLIDIPNEIEDYGYAPDVKYILSADKLKALGWQPHYDLADMYRRMIACWQTK